MKAFVSTIDIPPHMLMVTARVRCSGVVDD